MSSNSAQLAGASSSDSRIPAFAPVPKSLADYADIINLNRPPLPPNHPPLDPKTRASQFMPFSALSGYQDVVDAAESDSVYTEHEIIFEDIDDFYDDDFTE